MIDQSTARTLFISDVNINKKHCGINAFHSVEPVSVTEPMFEGEFELQEQNHDTGIVGNQIEDSEEEQDDADTDYILPKYSCISSNNSVRLLN